LAILKAARAAGIHKPLVGASEYRVRKAREDSNRLAFAVDTAFLDELYTLEQITAMLPTDVLPSVITAKVEKVFGSQGGKAARTETLEKWLKRNLKLSGSSGDKDHTLELIRHVTDIADAKLGKSFTRPQMAQVVAEIIMCYAP
jgi:hypothetical protein